MKRTNKQSYLIFINGNSFYAIQKLLAKINKYNDDDFIIYTGEKHNIFKLHDTICKLHLKYPEKYIIVTNLGINKDFYNDMIEHFNGNVLTFNILENKLYKKNSKKDKSSFIIYFDKDKYDSIYDDFKYYMSSLF